jgi:hypothetical protein
MPVMDGLEFLRRARALSPASVHIMLTGNADLQSAVQAVNDGHIFRFLMKPCPEGALASALAAAVAQYRLQQAEREVLEQTLKGSVQLVTEVLTLGEPAALSRALRARRLAAALVAALRVSDGWQIELAALLSQVGQTALGAASDEVPDLPANAAGDAAHTLLGGIPRLEIVAEMIRRTPTTLADADAAADFARLDRVAAGSQILHAALEIDRLLEQSCVADGDAVAQLLEASGCYHPAVPAAVRVMPWPERDAVPRVVGIAALEVGMLLREDLRHENGRLLVAAGQAITLPLLLRLRRVASQWPDQPSVKVLVPAA